MKIKWQISVLIFVAIVLLYFSIVGFGSSTKKVVISTNADEEAIAVMKKALDDHGFKGEYIVQPQSTSELGGKMMAEGKNIEADVITQATYYLESAQKENNMFANIENTNKSTKDAYPDYITPLLGNMGSLFVNKKALKEQGLEMPKSIESLTKNQYKDQVAMPNVIDSSTGWLVIQSILNEYGEKEGQKILTQLLKNIGPHLESSGSGPLKKVESGEAAIGIGLRSQAIDAEMKGKPIHYIDPKEGNFSLVEAAAVVKKGGAKQQKAEKMVQVIQKYGRKDLLQQYPVPLYKGEKVDKQQRPTYPKKWKGRLNVDLLESHQKIFQEAKKQAQQSKNKE
ncbi:extracellular solute-binding protein [Staphylococcus ureilyticus]|uniref:extracellular solute-binding protein n=1 Tax=Staphylococcus TaxID=1279 RepID=UPI001AEC34D4|nr:MULTISPECIES: extracellular solute-binding protein [unclassified Staphylococcus]